MLLELEETSSWGDPQLEIALGYVFAGASSWMGYKFPLLSKSDFSGLGKIGPTSGTFTSSNRQHGFRFSFFHMDTPDMCSKKPTSCAASCGKLRCLVPPSDDSRLETAFLLVQLAAGLFSPPCQIAKAEAEAGARLRLAEVFWLKSWKRGGKRGTGRKRPRHALCRLQWGWGLLLQQKPPLLFASGESWASGFRSKPEPGRVLDETWREVEGRVGRQKKPGVGPHSLVLRAWEPWGS